MLRTVLIPLLLLTSTSCGTSSAEATGAEATETTTPILNPSGSTLATRIAPPAGYERTAAAPDSYLSFLRQLPLKPDGAPVLHYNGTPKPKQVHAAVVDMEIGKRDLQQCADAVIRLRAEYLYKQQRWEEIHFNFTSGDRADFRKYAEGYRPSISGNSVSWKKTAAPASDYATFRQYLDMVFTYAGTASLQKELQQVHDFSAIKPGDVLIQGGHPGHAVLVIDMAVHKQTGKKLVLLAQSYMPAQDIHVLLNPYHERLSPWYEVETNGGFPTPEWHFSTSDLMRFQD